MAVSANDDGPHSLSMKDEGKPGKRGSLSKQKTAGNLKGGDGGGPSKKKSTKLEAAMHVRKGEKAMGLRLWIEEYESKGWPSKKTCTAPDKVKLRP